MSRQEATTQHIRAAQQSEEGFLELYHMYADRVYHFALVRTNHPQHAEEVVQETFLTVLAKLAEYTPTGAPFSSWVFACANNHVRNIRRRNKPVDDIDELAGVLSAEQHTHPEQHLDLVHALGQLSEDDATLLTLKYLDDASNRSIAQTLGISANTVGVKLYRARKRLRTILDQHNTIPSL